MVTQIKSKLQSLGQDVTRENLFCYLLNPAIPPIVEYTSQELISWGKEATSEPEIWEFVAMKHLCSTYNASSEISFQLMQLTVNQFRFKLIPIDWYNDTLQSLRGFDACKRNAQDEEHIWMQQGNMLCHIEDLEKDIFKNSSLLFNTKQGCWNLPHSSFYLFILY